ncbi:auxin-responsive protein IAA15 [Lathyrus oleraceus]|uniref:Auxin-induced protein n=1 Tax=Pisum sativum TaxID=3888 RepID=A0A9D4X3G4_PEA|nr:auxin-responsive protein IAA15 [Pisum sativum]KAI5414029.1 hypothetical protein KIW84_058245 [Pisum sativum]
MPRVKLYLVHDARRPQTSYYKARTLVNKQTSVWSHDTTRPSYTNLNMNIQEETKLTLALPGSTKSTTPASAATKRAFSTTLDLHLGTKHVVGWPPVRGNRKKIAIKTCKYVKVAVDGAPYLRKVDLEIYDGYDHLVRALDTMFVSTKSNLMNDKKYMLTYEDRDGDWMLLGDVPWKMFVDSCKRIRLMISMEDTTSCSSRCTGSSEKDN